jgi:hypothetical protein
MKCLVEKWNVHDEELNRCYCKWWKTWANFVTLEYAPIKWDSMTTSQRRKYRRLKAKNEEVKKLGSS